MTSEDVREYFEYRDGGLYWKKEPSKHGARRLGARFGYVDERNYREGRFRRKQIAEHQLVWLMFNDSLPLIVDHRDGDKSNNRIENLRAADYSTNALNSKMHLDNKAGHKGVTANPWGTYTVRVCVKGKQKCIGTYEDLELACLVADEARDLYHGEFARHN